MYPLQCFLCPTDSNHPSPGLSFSLDLMRQCGHKVTKYLGMAELFRTRWDSVQCVEDSLKSQALLTLFGAQEIRIDNTGTS